LRDLITELGYDGNEFSEHSHKRGAASESSSAGISETDIQEQGNWKSLATTRKYIDQSDTRSLSFTKKLIDIRKFI